MSPVLSRLRFGALGLAITFVASVLGYRLAGWSWLDAIYMVVITISTIGYGEVHQMADQPYLRMFTLMVILFGLTFSAYTIGNFLQLLAQGEIDRALGELRVNRNIEGLHDHIIICGFGRIGNMLCEELRRRRRKFVVIDLSTDRIALAKSQGHLYLLGDATDEEILSQAGLETARALVTALPDDASNVFITLTARDMNPKCFIIARGEQPSTEKKLLQAGASRVVMPASYGARQMANLLLRPSMAEIMEKLASTTSLNVQLEPEEVQLEELHLLSDSSLVGKSVVESQIRSASGLVVIAVKRHSGAVQFNPHKDFRFEAGDILIVMGRSEDILQFAADCRLDHQLD